MNPRLAPFLRVGGLAVLVLMLLYLPTREFLKVTFMLGIPLVFALAFMKKSSKYSLSWFFALLLALMALGGYLYMLSGLPQRIAVHQIEMDANILMTEGRFDEAREKFSQLEPYLSPENLNVKYSQVDKEKEAALKVEEARELMEAGKKDQARQLLESVPSDSMAQREAARLLKNLRE
ncbi:MAG: hypothetical protein ACOX0N_00985 [Syntrophomonadaceae bacterium]|jgi:tetratricopeptide (TPR) repeat protein|nr:hypothetical protein [Syntrophomonadaceae bacterium]